jgi:hypothetical protein
MYKCLFRSTSCWNAIVYQDRLGTDARTAHQNARRVVAQSIAGMAAAAEQLGNLSVASYVQLTDTEMECDGVLSYDRTPKFSAEQIAMIRKGAGNQTASFSIKAIYISKRIVCQDRLGTNIRRRRLVECNGRFLQRMMH